MENKTKIRLLYLYQYLLQHTDPEHPRSTMELTQMLLNEYDMKVSRNTIGDDLMILRSHEPLHIEYIESSQNKYYYDGHPFEVSELRILIDALCSAQFITDKVTQKLIQKLLTLTSDENAAILSHHISVGNHIKSESGSGYYSVDSINSAIEQKRKISFRYTDYDMIKKRQVVNDGQAYTFSPYDLIRDGNYYYVRGYCDERQAMRSFRLDRMESSPVILEEEAVPIPDDYRLSDYNREVFRMYDSDESVEVELRCHASIMKYLIDNFGREFDSQIIDKETFAARVKVCTSSTFYRWVFGFDGKIRITGPDSVMSAYKKQLKNAYQQYN